MALEFRTFKAASSGARFTTRVANTVKRVIEQIPSPSIDGLRSALTAARGGRDERAARVSANMTAPSTPGAAPKYPTTTSAAAPPDMAAAIRTWRAKKENKR